MNFGLVRDVKGGFSEVVDRVKAALREEGFGVLTEIDVQETFRKKLDLEFRPYRILGACNPVLAHEALTRVPSVGLLLPCNVVVEELDDGVRVSVADPRAMFSLVDDARLESVVRTAAEKLSKVIDTVSAGR